MTQYERDKLKYHIKQVYDRQKQLGNHDNDVNFKAFAHTVLQADTLQDGLNRLQTKTPLTN